MVTAAADGCELTSDGTVRAWIISTDVHREFSKTGMMTVWKVSAVDANTERIKSIELEER
jgi:hypothetical protein